MLAKNAQILKVTSKNLKNWETFRYLCNLKFSQILCIEFWLKVKLIQNKNFLKGFITKKRDEGQKWHPTFCKTGLKRKNK